MVDRFKIQYPNNIMYSEYILYFACVTQIYLFIIGIIIGCLDKWQKTGLQIVSIMIKVPQKDCDISLELIILIAYHFSTKNIFI